MAIATVSTMSRLRFSTLAMVVTLVLFGVVAGVPALSAHAVEEVVPPPSEPTPTESAPIDSVDDAFQDEGEALSEHTAAEEQEDLTQSTQESSDGAEMPVAELAAGSHAPSDEGIASLIVNDPLAGAAPRPVTFLDVPASHRFYTEIQWMYERGTTTGIRVGGGLSYQPNSDVSRGAMAAFLFRQHGKLGFASNKQHFADVPKTNKFYAAIEWMYAEGLTTGVVRDGKRFYWPTSSVSREAMAAFLYRLTKGGGGSVPAVAPFVDVQRTHKFAKEIAWMKTTKLSTGSRSAQGIVYKPGDSVSRAAMAAFLYRLDASAPTARQLTAPTPAVLGAPSNGQTLRVTPGAWGPAPVSLSYQWLRNGVAVGGAVGSSYVLTPTDALANMQVTVAGKKSGYRTTAKTSSVLAISGNLGRKLSQGYKLRPGMSLVSANGRFKFVIDTGGNAIVSEGSKVLWSSGTSGSNAELFLQADGNLVLYAGGTAKWSTNTVGSVAPRLVLRDDGNLVLYSDKTERDLWAANSQPDTLIVGETLKNGQILLSKGGQYKLGMQGDGNLVIYDGANAIWSTSTAGKDTYLGFQSDGNLVVYSQGKALWSSGTAGRSAKRLVMQSDGNLVLYAQDGGAIWSSKGSAPSAGARGDDYPAEYKNKALDAVVDRWNFYNRECTSFVAWRLNSVNGIAFTNQYRQSAGNRWGNAKEWAAAANRAGFAVDSNPTVGSVAWTNAGTWGHVAWVAEVYSNGTILVEEYNWNVSGSYTKRVVSKSSFAGYIHMR